MKTLDQAITDLKVKAFTDYESKLYKNANDRFRSKYGQDINWLNMYGMSIANYLAKGLKASEGDPESMRKYLQTLHVESIRGSLQMNEYGDVSMPHVVYHRKNGKSVPVGEAVYPDNMNERLN